MSTLIKPKKITHPLDEQAKTRLIGGHDSYESSGSEHSGYGVDEAPCLSELIHDFFHPDYAETTVSSDSSAVETSSYSVHSVENTLKSYININNNADDPYRKLLALHVSKAVQAFTYVNKRHDMQLLMRNVMSFLRQMGHNAGICKTKWDSSGGITAGKYEYIDVINRSKRYFIDLDFACQFEIARATDEYVILLKVLPRVFVGCGEELKDVVKLMSDEAKRSLKKRELSLPPWRKNRFMQNKWFASYRRTVNPVHACALPPVNRVVCQRVGFDDGVNSRCLMKTR